MKRTTAHRALGALAVALAAAFATPAAAQDAPKTEVAIFAGGCFWCTEADFDKVPGVISTTSGFAGGTTPNPVYPATGTDHTEVVRVVFDPAKVSYETLLDVYWRSIDPVDKGGQFCDRGPQYRTAIFYQSAEQKRQAEESKAKLAASAVLPSPIATEIAPGLAFYPVQDYHQDYYKKNPIQYKIYRYNCGRDKRLKELWGEKAAS
ncbi:MAG: peptide-methionine (S)-S-oxide reductase MsrA [Hyphomicrobiales bacterium]|nr:peptide-methionine (S)-S-oxide reductase MsrA [Hyphomicrobiales bacterium]